MAASGSPLYSPQASSRGALSWTEHWGGVSEHRREKNPVGDPM